MIKSAVVFLLSGFVICMTSVYWVWRYELRNLEKALRDNFRVLQVDYVKKLTLIFHTALDLNLVFSVSENIDSDGFKKMGDTLIKRNKMIKRITYAPKVMPVERDKFVAERRGFGYLGYKIKTDGDDSVEYYLPIQYIEPYTVRNSMLLGTDIYSLPKFDQVLRKVIENRDGNPMLIKTSAHCCRKLGDLIVAKATYKYEDAPDKRHRQMLFNGMILVELIPDNFRFTTTPTDFDLELLYDSPFEPERRQVLYSYPANTATVFGLQITELSFESEIIISGQSFFLNVHRHIYLQDLHHLNYIGAVLSSMLAVYLVWIIYMDRLKKNNELINRNREIEFQANEKTKKLHIFAA